MDAECFHRVLELGDMIWVKDEIVEEGVRSEEHFGRLLVGVEKEASRRDSLVGDRSQSVVLDAFDRPEHSAVDTLRTHEGSLGLDRVDEVHVRG